MAAGLAVTMRQIRQAEIPNQLAESIVSHSVINQAIGILMAQNRCTATEAFSLLRSASQNRNRKLRDVAAAIITNVSGQPPQPRPGFTLPPDRPAGRNRRFPRSPTPAYIYYEEQDWFRRSVKASVEAGSWADPGDAFAGEADEVTCSGRIRGCWCPGSRRPARASDDAVPATVPTVVLGPARRRVPDAGRTPA